MEKVFSGAVVPGRPDRTQPLARNLSIIVPAFNEEEKLEKTLNEVLSIAHNVLDDYEIIVIDDGSTDRTPHIARGFEQRHPSVVRVVRHDENLGVGAAYVNGLARAKFPFITLIPGDNAFAATGIERVFLAVNRANMVVSYRANPAARTPLRRMLSRFATVLVRGVTGRRIRDAHSMYVFPVELARQIKVSSGYSYHVETLCRLLLRIESILEVPVELNPKPDASSGVMKARTIMMLGMAMLRLYVLRWTGQLTKKH